LVRDAQGRLDPAFSLQRYYLDTNLGKLVQGTSENFHDLTSHEVIHYNRNSYLQDGSLQVSHIRMV
jgi:hypothetical protein